MVRIPPALEGARADLTITLPHAAPETILANHGDVHVSAIKAPVAVTANHGDVEISAITGAVTAHIHNSDSSFSVHSTTGPVTLEGRGGDVTVSDIDGPVSIEGDFFGSTHMEHVRNNVRFHTSRTDFQLARLDGDLDISSDEDLSADQAVGPVILNTRDRNITLERIAGDLSVTNRNGSINLTSAPPLGNVTVENRDGSVNLTLPDQAAFNVHAETTDGNLENDFALPVQQNDQHGLLTGTVGKGSAAIKITTSQGDIAIKKASIAPLPPLPPPPPPLTDVPPAARQALRNALANRKERLAVRQGRRKSRPQGRRRRQKTPPTKPRCEVSSQPNMRRSPKQELSIWRGSLSQLHSREAKS